MAEFLTDDWFQSLAQRAAETAVDPAISLTLQQTVEAENPIVWHTVIASGTVRIERGEAEAADVRLRSNFATAEGISNGSLSAQRAFLDGDLQIGGDLRSLMAARESLAGLSLLTG